MLVKLWAKTIIEGKRTFAQVPAKLKDGVKAALEAAGYGDLAE